MGYASDEQIKANSDALLAETSFAMTLAKGEAIINSKLAKSPDFAVPYADGEVPAILQEIAADFAAAFQLGKLYQQSGADDQLRGSLYLERRAREMLQDLIKGDAGIPATTDAQLPASGVIYDPDSASMRPVLRDFDLVNTPATYGRPPFGIPVRGYV